MMKIESYNKILKLKKNEKFVEVILKEEIPIKLYKYHALNKNSISNLTDNKIHFSHPYTLNDIMDGNFQLLNLDNVYKKIIQRDFGERTTLNDFNRYFIQKSNEFYKHIGVFCLTNSYANNLFWPHYTFEQGYTIEFNSKKLLKSFDSENVDVLPITYEKLQSIDLDKYTYYEKIIKGNTEKIDSNINLGLYYVLSYKDTIWKYENEWRIILRKENLSDLSHPLNLVDDSLYKKELNELQNRNFNFNPESIQKIILSNLFFNKHRFSKQVKEKKKERFVFRENEKQENKKNLLIDFLKILMQNHNDVLYQIDRHWIKDTNEFKSILTYKIQILDLSEKEIVIEREYCC